MDLALILSAALMGLAGTPHCLAMCGASCAAATGGHGGARLLAFHIGRILSYGVAGGIAAASVGTLASLGQATSVFRPIWTLLHVAALGLGFYLLWKGRQPDWMERLGRSRGPSSTNDGWQRIAGPGRSAALGIAWVAWPCGLLQSALLVSALANRPVTGAMSMVAFASTSAAGLLTGQAVWMRVAGGLSSQTLSRWMVRIGGLALSGASAWALGHGLWMRVWAWCTN